MNEPRAEQSDAAAKPGVTSGEALIECRFCAAELPARAQYCKNCNKFQSVYARVMSGFDLGSITTLLPIAALVFAFVQDRLTIARSDVRPVLLACSDASVRTGLSNLGNRPAIVRGGTAEMHAPGVSGVSRLLVPAGGNPFILYPQKTILSEFQFVLASDNQVSPMPPAPDPRSCRYDLKLTVVDFDGRRTEMPLESCKCPA